MWFLDGDDWLAPECLTEVAERLRATRPDVLLVDHVRTHWNDTATRSAMAEVVPGAARRRTPSGCGTGREAMHLLHTAWNRLVRREFLVDLGLRFAPGWYEDVSFSYPVLMAAERIGVLDRVCVNYRQRRAGAITRTRGDRHFEVFDQWHRVFRLMDAWGAGDGRPAAGGLRADDLALPDGARQRPADRRRSCGAAFFAQITADYERWLPPGGYPVPDGVEGLKHRLVASGRWRTFSALRAASRARDAARRQARTARRRSARSPGAVPG